MSYAHGDFFPPVDDHIEAYQPPLYYLISAGVVHIAHALKLASPYFLLKLFSTACGLITALCCYMAWTLVFGRSWFAFMFISACWAYLPMHIYLSPMVGNEMFTASITGIALVSVLRTIKKDDFSNGNAVITGIILGCCLLSKYSTIPMVACTFGIFVYHLRQIKQTRKRTLRFVLLVLGITVILSGWWYVRNAVLYDNPLISPPHRKPFQQIYSTQPPAKRVLKDIIWFDISILNNPLLAANGNVLRFFQTFMQTGDCSLYNTAFNSIPAGTYSTAWVENHAYFLTVPSRQVQRLAVFLVRIALLPTLIFIIGFTALLIHAVKSKSEPLIFMMCYFLLSIAAYLWFNIRYPNFSHVKAFFLLHTTPVLAISFTYAMTIFRKRSYLLFLTAVISIVITASISYCLYLL
ncbi:MAG: hypothetical protein AB1454_10340 [Candidatus Auribacterota bacterium]